MWFSLPFRYFFDVSSYDRKNRRYYKYSYKPRFHADRSRGVINPTDTSCLHVPIDFKLGLFIYSMLESLCKKLNMLYLQLWERSRWCPYLIWFTILLSITGEDMFSNLRAFTAGSVRHFFSLACNVDRNWTHKGKDP